MGSLAFVEAHWKHQKLLRTLPMLVLCVLGFWKLKLPVSSRTVKTQRAEIFSTLNNKKNLVNPHSSTHHISEARNIKLNPHKYTEKEIKNTVEFNFLIEVVNIYSLIWRNLTPRGRIHLSHGCRQFTSVTRELSQSPETVSETPI